jgi:hypothetical protein
MRWGDFEAERPELAAAGRDLLYQYGAVGLAFLATTRADGGPRMHPMCPLLTSTQLCAFIVPSPKQRDLHRDGRYAMHSFPTEGNEDAFYIAGNAELLSDENTRARFSQQFANERAMAEPPDEIQTWALFEFDVGSCLLTRTTGHGDSAPRHTVWRAGRVAPSDRSA